MAIINNKKAKTGGLLYMNEEVISKFSSDEWLNYFSTISNHWVLKYWNNNRNIFFDRFVIIEEANNFIIGDKEKCSYYEFKKPGKEIEVQLNLDI